MDGSKELLADRVFVVSGYEWGLGGGAGESRLSSAGMMVDLIGFHCGVGRRSSGFWVGLGLEMELELAFGLLVITLRYCRGDRGGHVKWSAVRDSLFWNAHHQHH